MLAHVANEQDAVVGRKAVEERLQLSRAGETRFVEHVEVSAVAVCLVRAYEMPLQGAGRDAGLFQLLRRAGGGREAFGLIAVSLGRLAEQGGRLPGAGHAVQRENLVVAGENLVDRCALGFRSRYAWSCAIGPGSEDGKTAGTFRL
jgi:hypothetical protein